MIWLIFALMLVATLAILLWPLLVSTRPEPVRAAYDLTVYRDQLAEIERDRERGLLGEVQLAAARLEIQRRMLAAEDVEMFVTRTSVLPPEPRRHWRSGFALLLAIPAGGLALYGWLGQPSLPGQPFASRSADPTSDPRSMIAHIETEMRNQPSADGYRMLGDLDSQQSRYEAAVDAYRRSVAIEPGAEAYASLAEAEVMVSGGSVTPEARQDFLSALRLDSKDPRGRFYLGLAESEIGEYAKAVAIWRDLEKDTPADAPWLSMLREHISSFAKQGGFDPASIPPAPPVVPAGAAPRLSSATSAISVAADDRQAMIRSMVDGLAAKMETQPELDGWLRLAQSYAVLGDAGKAEQARSHAAAMIAVMPSGTARASAQDRLEQLSN